jgi:hypothetical protein
MRLRLKRTSINSHSHSQLHKEKKEMADFRKWFFAFAVLALISSFAVPASAQNTPALQCVANAGVPPTVRAEGLTELVGDLVLNCNGGVPTQASSPVAAANVTIFLSTNITSRLTANPFSEALLMIDEPHSPTNPTVPLSVCDPTNATAGVCAITGNGTGVGTYNGTAGRPNVFQGRQTGVNQITFFGVPIDPPGTSNTRIIRVTNVRANANQLGVSSTLVPTQITMYVSITGSTSVPVNNPQQTVAFVQPGLSSSVRNAVSFIQCNDANVDIAKDATKTLNSGGQSGQQFLVRFDEGFGSAWKVRNIAQVLAAAGSEPTATDQNQNVPGAVYNTEAGFQNNTTDPSPNPPGATTSVPGTAVFPSVRGLNLAGVANQGTRLAVTLNAIPNGSQIFLPTRVNLVAPITGNITGYALLTTTDANGAGAFSAVSGNSSGLAPVSVFNGTGIAVYEVMRSDPFNIERMEVKVAVAFVANAGNNLPAPGVQSTATTGFAPLSNVGTASDTAPIPRFAPSGTPKNDFIINKCSCNILFPFVTNQQGFDTGVAIANTSVDPFGTTPQAGILTLNYYGTGVAPGFSQPTNAPVPGGQEVLFTLSGGGNFGIAATPGFQGYIIAQSQFQFCHAFAYISAQGALPTAPGASEGYLGIILDAPTLNRTGQVGENVAH